MAILYDLLCTFSYKNLLLPHWSSVVDLHAYVFFITFPFKSHCTNLYDITCKIGLLTFSVKSSWFRSLVWDIKISSEDLEETQVSLFLLNINKTITILHFGELVANLYYLICMFSYYLFAHPGWVFSFENGISYLVTFSAFIQTILIIQSNHW